jgi:RNA 3'-terminal phosphate cyclase
MKWLKTLKKAAKAAVAGALGGATATSFDPEKIVTDIVVGAVTSAVTVIFDWFKHRK